MIDYASARRYARALFEVSVDSGDPARTEADLAEFMSLIDEHPLLARALFNPDIPLSRKRAVVEAVLEKLPETSPLVSRLLVMLAERDRLALLPALHEILRDRLLDHRQVVKARVTTAEPLTAQQVAAITRTIETVTGREVQVETAVDENLVGGLVTRIGGTVFDGSVTHHLERLRQRFMTA